MSEATYYYIVYGWLLLGLITFFYLLKVPAPFGRHTSTNYGPMMDNKWGWIIMEIASPIFFSYFLFTGSLEMTTPKWIFWGLWVTHYFNRSLIYPFRQKDTKKKMPVLVMLSAVGFNFMNGFIVGTYLGNFAVYPEGWLTSPLMIIGVIVWLTGFFINFQSDNILLSLRKPGETGYKIPHGGMFRFISCPNHFGEIVEWTGFAIMTFSAIGIAGSLPTATFAVWTAMNLIPRAVFHHKWYLEKFTDYPKERRAVLPFVW